MPSLGIVFGERSGILVVVFPNASSLALELFSSADSIRTDGCLRSEGEIP